MEPVNEENSKSESLAAVDEAARDDSSDDSSSASSPLPVDRLGPLFQVVFGRVTVDPSILSFRVCRLDDPEKRDVWWDITRNYDDFATFHGALVAAPKQDGIIFPPIPQMLATRHEEEDFLPYLHKQLERYLQLVCAHPLLGRTALLSDFLSPSYTPPQDKQGRWKIFTRFAQTFETKKTANRDIEDFFENERQWSNNYSTNLKLVLGQVQTVAQCHRKLSGQLKHLSTALTMTAPSSNSTTEALNHRFRTEMSGWILKMHDLVDSDQGSENGFRTWHSIWDLYGQYVNSEQAMLNRRTAVLVGYENANRNWDKARNAKKDEAEVLKKGAEQAFEECSDAARHEIKLFHKQRVSEMRFTLTQLARHELEQARRMKSLLRQTLDETRRFHIPTGPLMNSSPYASI